MSTSSSSSSSVSSTDVATTNHKEDFFLPMAREDLQSMKTIQDFDMGNVYHPSKKKSKHHKNEKEIISAHLRDIIMKETQKSGPTDPSMKVFKQSATNQVLLVEERKKDTLHCYLRACCMRLSFELVYLH